MVYFGNLHSFEDYYLKKLSSNISNSFFFEYHYESINSVDSILGFINQISAVKKAIVLCYIKDKNDVSILLKLLKGLRITNKKDFTRIIVVNDFYGLKNFTLLKQRGADVIFEQKATKGAVNYAVMKLLNQITETTDKSYFFDVDEAPSSNAPQFTEMQEIPITDVNTETAYMQVSINEEDNSPIKCFLEDMDESSLVLKLPIKNSKGITRIMKKNIECKINLEYSTDKLDTKFPIFIKKMEFLGDHYFLYARNVEPNAESEKLFDIYGKRQKNISKFVFHSRA